MEKIMKEYLIKKIPLKFLMEKYNPDVFDFSNYLKFRLQQNDSDSLNQLRYEILHLYTKYPGCLTQEDLLQISNKIQYSTYDLLLFERDCHDFEIENISKTFYNFSILPSTKFNFTRGISSFKPLIFPLLNTKYGFKIFSKFYDEISQHMLRRFFPFIYHPKHNNLYGDDFTLERTTLTELFQNLSPEDQFTFIKSIFSIEIKHLQASIKNCEKVLQISMILEFMKTTQIHPTLINKILLRLIDTHVIWPEVFSYLAFLNAQNNSLLNIQKLFDKAKAHVEDITVLNPEEKNELMRQIQLTMVDRKPVFPEMKTNSDIPSFLKICRAGASASYHMPKDNRKLFEKLDSNQLEAMILSNEVYFGLIKYSFDSNKLTNKKAVLDRLIQNKSLQKLADYLLYYNDSLTVEEEKQILKLSKNSFNLFAVILHKHKQLLLQYPEKTLQLLKSIDNDQYLNYGSDIIDFFFANIKVFQTLDLQPLFSMEIFKIYVFYYYSSPYPEFVKPFIDYSVFISDSGEFNEYAISKYLPKKNGIDDSNLYTYILNKIDYSNITRQLNYSWVEELFVSMCLYDLSTSHDNRTTVLYQYLPEYYLYDLTNYYINKKLDLSPIINTILHDNCIDPMDDSTDLFKLLEKEYSSNRENKYLKEALFKLAKKYYISPKTGISFGIEILKRNKSDGVSILKKILTRPYAELWELTVADRTNFAKTLEDKASRDADIAGKLEQCIEVLKKQLKF